MQDMIRSKDIYAAGAHAHMLYMTYADSYALAAVAPDVAAAAAAARI